MTLTQLQAKSRRLLGNISSTDYSDANLNRSLNDYYQEFVEIGILSSGDWRVAGDYAVADLVASQDEYVLPSGLITIERIEVNLTGGTNTWSKAVIKDDSEIHSAISNTGSLSTVGPVVYFHDGSLFFEEAPDTSVTGGLKIWYSKEPTELSSGSDEPGIPEIAHVGLVYGACFDYSIERKLNDQMGIYRGLLEKTRQDIKDYYANREKTRRPRITTRVESYR